MKKPLPLRPIIKRSMIIALIVTPLITVVNQWDAVVGPTELNWTKVVLTCIIPFTVALVSGILSARQSQA